MRNVHGSMMDSAGSRPDAMARAQLRLTQASLPDPAHPRRAPLPLMPVAQALRAQSLLGHFATNQSAQALQAAAALPLLAFDASAAATGFEMTRAVVQQLLTLHADWVEGLTALGQEMSEVREANTVSKYVDQQMNLVQQGQALVSSQATSAVRLIENIQISMGWWLNQRATAAAL